MLSKEDKEEILTSAKKRLKEQLTQRIVDKALQDSSDRVEHFIAKSSEELNKKFANYMPK